MVREPGARWEVVAEQVSGERLVRVAPADITGFFLVSIDFGNRRIEGRMTFGDREALIETVVGPAGRSIRHGFRSLRFGLWEWADALDAPEIVQRDTAGVRTIDRLEAVVAGMASALRTLEPDIARAAARTIERVEPARARVLEDDRRHHLEADHRRATGLAAEAFRAGDFARVVELLRSVEHQLTDAERKKLAYARKRM